MSASDLPARDNVPENYKWNASSVFASRAAWEAEFKRAMSSVARVRRHSGLIGKGRTQLLAAMRDIEALTRRTGRLVTYAVMDHHVETTQPEAARLYGRAMGLVGQVMSAQSFLDPQLLRVGRTKLRQWMKAEPLLAKYAHYYDDLFRKQKHVRSAEVEEVLGMLADPFSGPHMLNNMLTSADFQFRPARSTAGVELPVAQSTFDELMANPDREVRRTAFESYTGQYLAFKNTSAQNLVSSIKQNVLMMRARRQRTTLDMALFESNIPGRVFTNLLSIFRKNLPTWHKYWAVRKRALAVDTLQPYDIWAPMAASRPSVTYEQAVDWVCAGMAPLGEEYVQAMRRGCLEQRWVDSMPSKGKTDGAFSAGSPGTHPFILMSWDHNIFSVSTLAHELGHSMHSYMAWQTQPLVYSNYSLFVAEVASNFNQAMTRGHLLKSNTEKAFQINVLEEALSNFHRYFFIMPTLARFELEVHQRIERGAGLTASDLNALMADLFTEGYGEQMHVDREQVGITWATFGHMYSDYYVYQYATGISGANALAKRILDGVPGAAGAYVDFLKAGGSQYPLELLKKAGVNLATPKPVESAFGVLSEYVDKLDELTR